MRKEFAETVASIMKSSSRDIFLTGDLGFMALEIVRSTLGSRFVNVGVSEQNMISLAAAMASEGLRPLCYSIAPFAIFRPAEQIRLDVCLHGHDVKIVGNGGGYGYGIMGATHHAIEDLAVMSSFQNMVCMVPWCNQDVPEAVLAMFKRVGPTYLRLGYGIAPEGLAQMPWAAVRQIQFGSTLTIISIGPVVLNGLKALALEGIAADVFVVSELPFLDLGDSLRHSVAKTGKVLVIEEHVQRGGLAETLALHFLRTGLHPVFRPVCACGYPNGLYGSQAYHQELSGLDSKSLAGLLRELLDA